jgi:hypothetical protein
MIKEIFNLVLSASQLPDSTGPEKKAIVMAQLKDLDIPGYDEDVASLAVDICVRIYKCDETKKIILETKTCCKRKLFK